MNKKSKSNLGKVLLIGSMAVGFLSFAVIPLIHVFQSNSNTPVPNAGQVKKEELLKKLAEIEKEYEEIVKREPKNTKALQGLIGARLKIFQITGDVEMLKKSQAPLDELIKQEPKNDTLQAIKKQIQLIISKEGKK